MLYTYNDTFLIDSLDGGILESIENDIILEINKLNVQDEFIYENLVKNRVYMQVAKLQLEAAGMLDKYNIYKKEYDIYLKKSLPETTSQISSISLSRG